MEFPNFGKPHESQRGYFAAALYEQMIANKDIWLLTGDLGFGMLDKIMQDFPERAKNIGAAEQSMLGIAVGLALENNKIPFCYTISSFYLRAAETIGLYLHGEQIPVKLVGSGRDDDYKHDGSSHHAGLAQAFLAPLNVLKFYPETKEDVVDYLETIIKNEKPCFLSLRR